LDALHREQERMTDGAHEPKRLHLLLGAVARGAIEVVVGARNQFDGLEQTAGRFTFPDLAEPPFAERFEQPIAGYRLSECLNVWHHHEGPEQTTAVCAKFASIISDSRSWTRMLQIGAAKQVVDAEFFSCTRLRRREVLQRRSRRAALA